MRRGVKQTLADAVLVGKHAIRTPEAHALTGNQAVLRLATRTVCERDIRLDALDAPAVIVHGTVASRDAVRRVEEDRTTCTRRAGSAVTLRALVPLPADAAVKDKVAVARQALARAARLAPRTKEAAARNTLPVLVRHKGVVTRDSTVMCLDSCIFKNSALAVFSK